MKKWKKILSEKRERIKDIERERWDEKRDYQGEKENGIRHGFGIMHGIGEYDHVRYEGEFKDGKMNGTGIYRF